MDARSLSAIARDIRRTWPNMPVYASVYVDAMATADRITDIYIVGDHHSTVLGFLANAQTWRGEDARRIKAELKALL